MYKFKNDNITVMYFIKARCDGQIVRMHATADTNDAFRKIKEYKKQGFAVTGSCKPITYITRDGHRVTLG